MSGSTPVELTDTGGPSGREIDMAQLSKIVEARDARVEEWKRLIDWRRPLAVAWMTQVVGPALSQFQKCMPPYTRDTTIHLFAMSAFLTVRTPSADALGVPGVPGSSPGAEARPYLEFRYDVWFDERSGNMRVNGVRGDMVTDRWDYVLAREDVGEVVTLDLSADDLCRAHPVSWLLRRMIDSYREALAGLPPYAGSL